MFNLFLSFSEIPNIFTCVRVRPVAFLFEDWKKLSVLSSVLFTVFAIEMREREAYRNLDGIRRVRPSQQDLRLRAWPIYAGFHAVSWLFANT